VLSGINDSIIIDDTYNSSPIAAEGAMETLGKVNATRKIAVLGDMLELGRHTDEAHKNLGALAKKNSDILVVVGPRAKFIKEGAEGARMAKKNIFEFNNSKEAAEFMQGFVVPGDLVLVKGSQGVRMERVTAAILKDKENRAKLLVRQEDEWLGRD
jgi:UDP-N-acetylmuramoyl-tripeptide--D-alanyl-D-alanine ligase